MKKMLLSFSLSFYLSLASAAGLIEKMWDLPTARAWGAIPSDKTVEERFELKISALAGEKPVKMLIIPPDASKWLLNKTKKGDGCNMKSPIPDWEALCEAEKNEIGDNSSIVRRWLLESLRLAASGDSGTPMIYVLFTGVSSDEVTSIIVSHALLRKVERKEGMLGVNVFVGEKNMLRARAARAALMLSDGDGETSAKLLLKTASILPGTKSEWERVAREISTKEYFTTHNDVLAEKLGGDFLFEQRAFAAGLVGRETLSIEDERIAREWMSKIIDESKGLEGKIIKKEREANRTIAKALYVPSWASSYGTFKRKCAKAGISNDGCRILADTLNGSGESAPDWENEPVVDLTSLIRESFINGPFALLKEEVPDVFSKVEWAVGEINENGGIVIIHRNSSGKAAQNYEIMKKQLGDILPYFIAHHEAAHIDGKIYKWLSWAGFDDSIHEKDWWFEKRASETFADLVAIQKTARDTGIPAWRIALKVSKARAAAISESTRGSAYDNASVLARASLKWRSTAPTLNETEIRKEAASLALSNELRQISRILKMD